MPKTDYTTHLVSGLFIQDDQVLLGLRINTRDYPNHWSLPIGHVEKGETQNQAISRELHEELGIHIQDFQLVCRKTDEQHSILHQVFKVNQWHGDIVNCEPQWCEQLKWSSLDGLPKNITPISLEIINMHQS